MHCVKSVQIRRFFWSISSCILTKYGGLLHKSPYSVQKQENTDQKKSRIWKRFTQSWLWGLRSTHGVGGFQSSVYKRKYTHIIRIVSC